MLASCYAGPAAGAVGGKSRRLHPTQLPAVPVSCMGAGARLDHRFSVIALHPSVCRIYRNCVARKQLERGKTKGENLMYFTY